MDNQEKLSKGVGTKDPKKLETGKVTILGVRLETIEKAKGKEIAVFIVKHPDKDDLELSKAKVNRKDKLKVYGLWYTEDEEENIQKGSALAEVMSFYEITSLDAAVGKEIETTEDEDGYLCVKAYN